MDCRRIGATTPVSVRDRHGGRGSRCTPSTINGGLARPPRLGVEPRPSGGGPPPDSMQERGTGTGASHLEMQACVTAWAPARSGVGWRAVACSRSRRGAATTHEPVGVERAQAALDDEMEIWGCSEKSEQGAEPSSTWLTAGLSSLLPNRIETLQHQARQEPRTRGRLRLPRAQHACPVACPPGSLIANHANWLCQPTSAGGAH